MARKYTIYNLHFSRAAEFTPFEIDGYEFVPIPEKQPKPRQVYPADYWIKQNRKMILDAYVNTSKKERNSIFLKDATYSGHGKVKFIADILVLMSILIAKNVVLRFHERFANFPICVCKHCEVVARNSSELKECLGTALRAVLDADWQTKYDNGFHIWEYYNFTNIYVLEPRYLAEVTIWEFLHYCHNRTMSYDKLAAVSLNTKVNFLVRQYLGQKAIREERLRVFADMRNQLSHNGLLPIQNTRSPFAGLEWGVCQRYVTLFRHLTQVLILATLGIDSIRLLDVLHVKAPFTELLSTGRVRSYEQAQEA